MWTALLDQMLTRYFRDGTIVITMPDGSVRRYGSGTPEARITIRDEDVIRRIVANPEMGVGESYMDGTLEIEDLRAFFAVALPAVQRVDYPWFERPVRWAKQATRLLRQMNGLGRSRHNVAHHYDLSGELYDLFLDADRQYSCAYFARPDMTLDEAQAAKKHHIAHKLCLEPGMRVLDIGCGWGGMALTLARDYGAHVVGVTLSKEQHAVAVQRAAEAGLSDRIDIRLQDYRHVSERFDRIVSVGMFEHVGVPQYDTYFGKVDELLSRDGLALIHTIGHVGPPNYADPWMEKYIFPGGYAPALSEIQAAVDKRYLVTQDIEVLRTHYAKTLGHWHDRFMARVNEARALYDERFVRMWRYYLLSMEAAFTCGSLLVYQLQLGHRFVAAPITRDYLYPHQDADHQRYRSAAE
ncbi:cyclopropane-fatty-acyl-phospholipid synthase family protein [Maritimibacter sp. DP1N21-5]|uniref:SAM-dependent methyltransferase n=1 Tax=Maritimibacter sp. DP1N21-5 TaxID=2836867 RepID=UPI001C48AB5C|nr:cyclopropane-fatty-acyl-phospholipid synthase family protein [Maritimibacter sp. DP1N21-5]MBV7408047.1 cyclopropane-fatty-acyl-phospholipid synthase family protein [Maritimibacter sp. DP1N21-5]